MKLKSMLSLAGALAIVSGAMAKDSEPDSNGVVKLDISEFTNMGLEDDAEGDGIGGWNDDGANNGKNFPIFKEEFAGVPFKIINPAENGKTSIAVFRHDRKLDGLDKIEMNVKPAAKAKALNLLHCTAWEQPNIKDKPVGYLEVTDESGRVEKFTVKYEADVSGWWSWGMPKNQPNKIMACQIPAAEGNGYAFASQYKLPDDFGKVAKVTIKGTGKDSVAYWMLIAATLTPTEMLTDKPMAKPEPLLITDGKEWREFRLPAKKGVVKGSILDFRANIGENKKGKVILREDGEYVYEDSPDDPVRFMFTGCHSIDAYWNHPTRNKHLESCRKRGIFGFTQYNNKEPQREEDVKTFVKTHTEALADYGYNAVFLVDDGAQGLAFIKGEKDGDMNYSKELLDTRDYEIKCLKDEGLKIIWGAARLDGYWRLPWTRYCDPLSDRNLDKIDHWLPGGERRDRTVKAMDILFNQKNPYTGLTVMKDPDVISFLMNNECDLGGFHYAPALDIAFQKEMAQKYKTIDALKKAWGCESANWKSFDDLPRESTCWQKDMTQKGLDYYQFMLKVSKENLAWFTSVCRNFGTKSPVTSYDMTKDYYRTLAREDAGCVYMHVYHGHPMNKDISQESVIGNANGFFRNMAASQYVSKPIFMTEANVVFWNQYRYEQAFALNAYAALNGFDGILNFTGIYAGAGRSDTSHDLAKPFFGSLDPIAHATEFLGMHIYRNKAVKKSPVGVRLRFTPEELLKDYGYRFAPNGLQTKLSLVFRFGLETPKTAIPMTDKDVIIPRAKGSMTRDEKLFSLIVEDKKDASFDIKKFLCDMKEKGLLPKDNRTDPDKDIWESCTGELYIDAGKKFGAIKTDCVQGVCALAGTSYHELPDFKINSMTKNGTLNVVAVDGKPVKESKRLAVVYATNALNRNMKFTDKTMRTVIEMGDGTGLLYECGSFDVEINSAYAKTLRAWTVTLDGRRGCEIPVVEKNGRAWLRVNVATLPDGPTVFFELAEK